MDYQLDKFGNAYRKMDKIVFDTTIIKDGKDFIIKIPNRAKLKLMERAISFIEVEIKLRSYKTRFKDEG